MEKRIDLFPRLLFFLTYLAGCATMGDVEKAKDEGTSKVYLDYRITKPEVRIVIVAWQHSLISFIRGML